MSMQNQLSTMFDLNQKYQAIGIRRLVRFGATMGIALAGQILVTLILGSLSWMQQHMLFMVMIELVWWPPFFFILYLSFSGVVKFVEQMTGTHKSMRSQFDAVCQLYEERCNLYEVRLQEQNIKLNRLRLQEKVRVPRLEPMV